MRCTICLSPLQEGSRFCPACGAAVQSAPAQSSPVPVQPAVQPMQSAPTVTQPAYIPPVQPVYTQPVIPPMVQPYYAPPGYVRPQPPVMPPTGPRRNNLGFAGFVLGVVGAALAAFGLLLMLIIYATSDRGITDTMFASVFTGFGFYPGVLAIIFCAVALAKNKSGRFFPTNRHAIGLALGIGTVMLMILTSILSSYLTVNTIINDLPYYNWSTPDMSS